MADNDETTGQEQEGATPGEQGGWTPPESQEQLDQIIQARVARAAENVEQRVKKDFEGYVPPDEVNKLREEIAERDAKLQGFERENVARSAGLPEGFGSRLQGASAEEWQQDAASLAGALLGAADKSKEPVEKPVSPSYQPRERRGVGGGNPSDMDAYASKSPAELIKNVPRF